MNASTAAHDAHEQSHEQWWAGLSQEERYLAIETVRLDQDADWGDGRPTGERAAWLRRRPEYLERWAGAENIARQDATGIGLDTVPDAHGATYPLAEDEDPQRA